MPQDPNSGQRIRIPLPPPPEEVLKHFVYDISKIEDFITNIGTTMTSQKQVAALNDAKLHLARARGMIMVAVTGGVDVPLEALHVRD